MSALKDRLKTALAERQKTAQKGERVSQAGLARACHVAAPSVTDWFSGRTQALEGANLVAAAAYLRVRPEWLASGKGSRELDAATGAPEPSTEPRRPSSNYEDRLEVSKSDFMTLQAVKTILSDAELADIRRRADEVERRVLDHIDEVKRK